MLIHGLKEALTGAAFTESLAALAWASPGLLARLAKCRAAGSRLLEAPTSAGTCRNCFPFNVSAPREMSGDPFVIVGRSQGTSYLLDTQLTSEIWKPLV